MTSIETYRAIRNMPGVRNQQHGWMELNGRCIWISDFSNEVVITVTSEEKNILEVPLDCVDEAMLLKIKQFYVGYK